MVYGCFAVSVIVLLFTTVNLRGSLRAVFTEIKRFPFKYQVTLMAVIGGAFSVAIGVLTFIDGEKYQIVCGNLLIAGMVLQLVYNIILSIVHRRVGVKQLVEQIEQLGFDAFSDSVAVRRELMQNSNRAYSVSEVTKALDAMKKKEL